MNFLEIRKKYFKSTEEVVSMFLGLVIVLVVIGLIFNYFQKSKGVITIPGTTDINLIGDNGNLSKTEGVYQVVKGDSLWKIAVDKYNDGYAWTEIAKANNLKNPSSLETGQKLNLPKLEVKEVITKITQNEEYKVVKNDSLWKIAVQTYGDGYQWVKIWQENKSKLIDPNRLEIGMILTIPSLK